MIETEKALAGPAVTRAAWWRRLRLPGDAKPFKGELNLGSEPWRLDITEGVELIESQGTPWPNFTTTIHIGRWSGLFALLGRRRPIEVRFSWDPFYKGPDAFNPSEYQRRRQEAGRG